jgi:hypothetical protein
MVDVGDDAEVSNTIEGGLGHGVMVGCRARTTVGSGRPEEDWK